MTYRSFRGVARVHWHTMIIDIESFHRSEALALNIFISIDRSNSLFVITKKDLIGIIIISVHSKHPYFLEFVLLFLSFFQSHWCMFHELLNSITQWTEFELKYTCFKIINQVNLVKIICPCVKILNQWPGRMDCPIARARAWRNAYGFVNRFRI